ncbi:hypothetical protein M422DRAFT_52167 [Sphaerobolus stellatus SS14]|uniref:Uncharacterized protein n=1 Tax=Sphaerobolus stellatus (strain SS14) TaxID=990650 RepID=A0A0C9UGX1_SPHS4|nr:hypothetical protein M422DRAFT_52167 [Sphaerobolus stellatus SS14]
MPEGWADGFNHSPRVFSRLLWLIFELQDSMLSLDSSLHSVQSGTIRRILTHLKRQRAALNQTAPATIRGLTLAYSFTSIPSSRGKLQFTITSSNVPSVELSHHSLSTLHTYGQACQLKRVGGDVTSVFGDAISVIISVATEAASDIKSIATEAASAVKSVASNVIDAVNINKTETSHEIPLNLDQNFTLVDLTIQSKNANNDDAAHLKIDVDAHVNATVNFGYILAGSLVPPKVDEAAIFAHLARDASFTFGLEFESEGKYDTLPVNLFKSGLPSLSIPGLGTLGPEFVLAARLQMDVEVAAQIDVMADFNFPDVIMTFPQDHGSSSTTNSVPQSTGNGVSLSTANAGIDAKGTITATLILSIQFGIDLTFASATVFVDLEIGGVLDMKSGTGIGRPTIDSGNSTSTTATQSSASATTDSNNSTASASTDATQAPATAITDNITDPDDTTYDDSNAVDSGVDSTSDDTADASMATDVLDTSD